MGETCTGCGVPVSGASVLYAPDGRIVCPACFDKFAPIGPPSGAPWRMFGIAGLVVGVIPFAVHVSSSSSTTMNGQVTSFVYRDWIAVACGVVAITIGIITLVAARKEQLQRALAFAAGAGVLVLGGVQIARGLGVFATVHTSADSSTSSGFEFHEAAPETGDPNSPDTCPDPQSCFDLAKALDKSGDATSSLKANIRACDKGAIGGCYNAGHHLLHQEPPALAKAMLYYGKACDHNDLDGCDEVGRISATDGETKDLDRAKAMFEKACKGEFADGCAHLALMYDQGVGVTQDEKMARSLFETACTGGVADSCFFLGEVRRQGLGGPKDAEGAVSAYAAGCKGGNQEACNAAAHASEPATKSAAKKPASKKTTKKKRK